MTHSHASRSLRMFAIAFLAAVSLSTMGSARPVRLWSDAELWDQADVVVLAKAVSTKDINLAASDPPPPKTWVAVATTFDVQVALKGKPAGESIQLRHYRYQAKESDVAVIDGPSFVEFTPDKRQYLIFLKAKKVDDQVEYEPLTGQYDPDGSFRRLEPYRVTDERKQNADAPTKKPTVADGPTGIVVALQDDERTIVAVDTAGKSLWSADVIKVAGPPGQSAPIVRSLLIKDGELTAVYGKHNFAVFELKTGKLISMGSD